MDAAALIRKYAGQWVAWNRQQDRVISSGRTFEEAKQSAAAAGETSVILAKASRKGARHPHWLSAVAVFIALGSPASLPGAVGESSPQSPPSAESSYDDASPSDVASNRNHSRDRSG